jgi:hypothetical protein
MVLLIPGYIIFKIKPKQPMYSNGVRVTSTHIPMRIGERAIVNLKTGQ